MQPGAGKDRGWSVLPEVGDEVLVAFEQGDFSRPTVLGGLFNGVDTMPSGPTAAVDASSGAVNRRSLVSRNGHRIDLLDESLVRLLNARAACALEIGRVKRELDMPIYQPEREAEVLKNVQGWNNGPLDQQAIKRLFERIIDEARHLERIADEVQSRKSE